MNTFLQNLTALLIIYSFGLVLGFSLSCPRSFLPNFLLLSRIILVSVSSSCFMHPCCSYALGILCGIHTPCMGSPFPVVRAKWFFVFRSVNNSYWPKTVLSPVLIEIKKHNDESAFIFVQGEASKNESCQPWFSCECWLKVSRQRPRTFPPVTVRCTKEKYPVSKL